MAISWKSSTRIHRHLIENK